MTFFPHLPLSQVNDWSSCQAVCSSLLARDPDNEPALLMLADLAYRRVDFQDASVHFSALLTRHPSYWVALARLIEVKRRTAQLDEARPFLQVATQAAANEPALSYCTGESCRSCMVIITVGMSGDQLLFETIFKCESKVIFNFEFNLQVFTKVCFY